MKKLMVMVEIILPSLCFHLCRILGVSEVSAVSSASTSYTKDSCFLSKRKSRIVTRSSIPSRCGRGRRLKKYSESVAVVRYCHKRSRRGGSHKGKIQRRGTQFPTFTSSQTSLRDPLHTSTVSSSVPARDGRTVRRSN